LLHGDFHLGNVIATELGNVCAVIDWEMAALGDPFVDLGCALAYWQQPDDDPELVPLPSGLLGFPSRRSMAELYATFADRDVTALDLYVAFGHWKLGRIAADIRARLRRGTMGALEVEAALLDRQVAARLRAASEALAGHW
jgi:aminoglycoside phosphotransferase (APT) family kinase protein